MSTADGRRRPNPTQQPRPERLFYAMGENTRHHRHAQL
ncbi:MAG: hypothetical protein QOK40_3258, partial [Miltoncostaeaceae bacterium]|nr:hypothetical protein [Miltoncostaeaceae bacterium]